MPVLRDTVEGFYHTTLQAREVSEEEDLCSERQIEKFFTEVLKHMIRQIF